MGLDVSLLPNGQITASFQGPRHEIAVQLPNPENVTVSFVEQINQVVVTQINPNIEVSLVAGIPGSPSQGASGFTPADVSAASLTHLYFGYDGANWLVRRMLRSGSGREVATVGNNPTVLTFAAAWTARETLDYEPLP